MAKAARARDLDIRPLTPARADNVKAITASTWGSQCWDLWWRFTKPLSEVFRDSSLPDVAEAASSKEKKERQRRAMLAKLARRRHTPVLIAYDEGEPVGFVSLGPRSDYQRFRAQKTTQPVDDVPAWVIPCITVRRGYRGKGVALAMIRAALVYAGERGAPALEAYPRAETKRVRDDFAYIGTEAMFRRAGFRRVRGVQKDLPKGWTPRVTMRAACAA